MTRTLVTNAIAALLALPLFAAPAAALPEDQAVFTDFEDVSNTLPGEIIVVGVSPDSADLGGDAIGGRFRRPSLYHSGLRAWMVLANGTGVITFETDAATVEFWARVIRFASGNTFITAFDGCDVIVDEPVTIRPGTGWQLVSLTGSIARIDVVNLDANLLNGIDDFGFTPVPEIVAVEIDIKPGSDPNSINPSLEGDLPVAILGSDSFDVEAVDVLTLAFGCGDASFDHSQGPHFEDLDGDGFTDLMAHFRIEAAGIQFGDMEACVTGETLDGMPFEGCDAVRTVPDMDGDKLLDTEEAAIGTNALNPDTDGDGFGDGQEVLLMGTDPLDPLDPTPDPVPERRRKRMRRR